jgi:hypothetical protein
MAALLFEFETHADYRAAVKREFDGIHALFGEYQEALKKVYSVPTVPDPKQTYRNVLFSGWRQVNI